MVPCTHKCPRSAVTRMWGLITALKIVFPSLLMPIACLPPSPGTSERWAAGVRRRAMLRRSRGTDLPSSAMDGTALDEDLAALAAAASSSSPGGVLAGLLVGTSPHDALYTTLSPTAAAAEEAEAARDEASGAEEAAAEGSRGSGHGGRKRATAAAVPSKSPTEGRSGGDCSGVPPPSVEPAPYPPRAVYDVPDVQDARDVPDVQNLSDDPDVQNVRDVPDGAAGAPRGGAADPRRWSSLGSGGGGGALGRKARRRSSSVMVLKPGDCWVNAGDSDDPGDQGNGGGSGDAPDGGSRGEYGGACGISRGNDDECALPTWGGGVGAGVVVIEESDGSEDDAASDDFFSADSDASDGERSEGTEVDDDDSSGTKVTPGSDDDDVEEEDEDDRRGAPRSLVDDEAEEAESSEEAEEEAIDDDDNDDVVDDDDGDDTDEQGGEETDADESSMLIDLTDQVAGLAISPGGGVDRGGSHPRDEAPREGFAVYDDEQVDDEEGDVNDAGLNGKPENEEDEKNASRDNLVDTDYDEEEEEEGKKRPVLVRRRGHARDDDWHAKDSDATAAGLASVAADAAAGAARPPGARLGVAAVIGRLRGLVPAAAVHATLAVAAHPLAALSRTARAAASSTTFSSSSSPPSSSLVASSFQEASPSLSPSPPSLPLVLGSSNEEAEPPALRRWRVLVAEAEGFELEATRSASTAANRQKGNELRARALEKCCEALDIADDDAGLHALVVRLLTETNLFAAIGGGEK